MLAVKNLSEFLFHNDLSRPYLVGEESTYNYGQAIDAATRLATYLSALGIKGQNVLVFAAQTPETILSFYGILMSGNAYVPLDPSQVEKKVKSVIAKAGIKYQICLGEEEPFEGLIPIYFTEAMKYDPRKEDIAAFRETWDENAPAYIVFTSGSTGEPKGVVKSHRAMFSFVKSFLEQFPIKEERMASQSPFYFDASMKDVYLSVASHSTLYIPSRTYFALPTKIMQYLVDHEITYLCWVPSALSLIARVRLMKYYPLPHLRYVFFVGEVFAAKYLNAWRAAYPSARFINLYGSSELAGVCLYYEITRDLGLEEAIPLGKPLPGNHVYLHDEEILIQSEQIAVGYLGEEERNRLTFEVIEGKKTLHSGDYGYVDSEGNFVFSCRKDFQIKHMGHRIELQEIELAYLSLPYVEQCCCVLEEKGDRIVLFLSSSDSSLDVAKVLSDGESLLSPYMRPNDVKILPSLPLSPNGKIDRVALKSSLTK